MLWHFLKAMLCVRSDFILSPNIGKGESMPCITGWSSIFIINSFFNHLIIRTVAQLGIWIDGFQIATLRSQSQFLAHFHWRMGKFWSFLSKIYGFQNPLFKNWWVPRNPWNQCQQSHWKIYIWHINLNVFLPKVSSYFYISI